VQAAALTHNDLSPACLTDHVSRNEASFLSVFVPADAEMEVLEKVVLTAPTVFDPLLLGSGVGWAPVDAVTSAVVGLHLGGFRGVLVGCCLAWGVWRVWSRWS